MKAVMYDDRIYFIKSIECHKCLPNCCKVTLLLGQKLLVNYQKIIDIDVNNLRKQLKKLNETISKGSRRSYSKRN